MSVIEPPDWDKLGRDLANSMRTLSAAMAAAGAISHMMRGDLDAARQAIEGIGTGSVRDLSVAAATLASMCDEVLAGRAKE